MEFGFLLAFFQTPRRLERAGEVVVGRIGRPSSRVMNSSSWLLETIGITKYMKTPVIIIRTIYHKWL